MSEVRVENPEGLRVLPERHSQPDQDNKTDTYETCCGQCGDVMIFKQPLKGWTAVFCRVCNQTVYVI